MNEIRPTHKVDPDILANYHRHKNDPNWHPKIVTTWCGETLENPIVPPNGNPKCQKCFPRSRGLVIAA